MAMRISALLLVAHLSLSAASGPVYAYKESFASCKRGYWASGCGQPAMKQKGTIKCIGTEVSGKDTKMFEAEDKMCKGTKPSPTERTCPATAPCPRCKGCKRDGGCWKACMGKAGKCSACDSKDGREGACCQPGNKDDPIECKQATFQFENKNAHTCALLSKVTVKTILKRVDNSAYVPLEPPLPGVMPGIKRPHIVLAQDIDYPPYAYLGDPSSGLDCEGFGHDVAMGLKEVCDIDITVVQTGWGQCWGANKIGEGLLDGHFHGCMTYTHTVGVRNRYLEFSAPILKMNKAAGLIVRLDPKTGKPLVNGNSDLSGLKVVDVIGWAPTQDGLYFVKNSCKGGSKFKGFTYVEPTHNTGNANDDALKTLLDGKADVMWAYADQAFNYQCTDKIKDPAWDCKAWAGLGKTFAYIHTGLFKYMMGGTTLSISKKGSGLSAILDPCIAKFKQTKGYYDVCDKNGLSDSCYPNSFFPKSASAVNKNHPFKHLTKDLTTSCKDGYCPCSA